MNLNWCLFVRKTDLSTKFIIFLNWESFLSILESILSRNVTIVGVDSVLLVNDTEVPVAERAVNQCSDEVLVVVQEQEVAWWYQVEHKSSEGKYDWTNALKVFINCFLISPAYVDVVRVTIRHSQQ